MSERATYASPPCTAAEVDPADFDPLATDPDQARDVARRRRAELRRLARLREGLGQAGLATIGIALAAASLPTIYPQPNVIPLDMIVTESGISGERKVKS